MRLIDGDELKLKLPNAYRLLGREEVNAYIDRMPTVDAAPVVHGKWTEQHVDYTSDCAIDEIQELKCSVCGLYHTTPYLYNITHYKFCPNCGAKMDLEG